MTPTKLTIWHQRFTLAHIPTWMKSVGDNFCSATIVPIPTSICRCPWVLFCVSVGPRVYTCPPFNLWLGKQSHLHYLSTHKSILTGNLLYPPMLANCDHHLPSIVIWRFNSTLSGFHQARISTLISRTTCGSEFKRNFKKMLLNC